MRKCIAAAFLALLPGLASAQGKLDLNFQEAPRKPTPDWVKLADQGQFDPRLKGYFAPEGIKVEIVADAPDVINPVGMTFGPDGTLYVLEWVETKDFGSPKQYIEFTYKDGSKRKVLIARKPIRDRVKTLGYNNKKGVYDSHKVVLEPELPSSILIHDGWMYLSGQGTVRRHKQLPDGTWDKKEQIIAHGFCGWHHHQVSGLTIGNDGWLYITSGDNDNVVEGSDGSRATVLRTGAIFRCRPDGSKMHVYSVGYRNPYRDVAFDDKFNMFHADNDNEDGSKWTGCRLMHIADGVDFGWRLRPGAECCIPDFIRSAVYGELPGKLAPMHKTGRGSPAGLLIYNDTYFPDTYKGLLLYPDVFRRVIRAYQPSPAGASFEITHEFEFLRSNDPLFRPCQMVLGPDGAMYVCDWRTDSGGAGKLWGDGKHGRIYRLSWAGTKEQPALPLRGLDSWAKITKQSDEDLLKTLDSENFSDRLRAQQEIVRRGDKQKDKLVEILKNANEKTVQTRIAAIGALQSIQPFDATPFIDRLRDPSADIRRLAADALALNCKKDGDVHDALSANVNEADPAVKRAIYIAIGRNNAPLAADVIVNGLQFDKGNDDYLWDGLVRALEFTGKDGIAKLLALADSGAGKDLDRVLEIYPTLRTREAVEKLPVLLANYHVKPEQKAQLIRTYLYCQVEPPISVAPLEKFLDDLPKAPTKKITEGQLNSMKLAALDVLASSGKVDSAKVKATLIAMLKAEDPKSRQAVLTTIADAKLTSATPILIDQLAAATEDADKLALIRTLGLLSERSAFNAVQAHARAKSPALRIEVLRALSSIDYRPARKIAESLLDDADVQVQREAVVMLGQSVEGARVVGQRFVAKKLPRAMLPEVSESLRRFAGKENPDVAELLSNVVKGGLLVSLEPDELKRVSAMVQKQGDPLRGRQLYLNHKTVACMSCHRLEGIGGNVGPDLTRVWDTLSLEKVMESMLDPSKEIKEGYQTYTATTKTGLTYSGLKVSQNAKELILKDATGKEVHIAAGDLDEVAATKKSLMPDDVVRHLSFGEFIDLVAFLRDRKAQEELRGLVLTAWAVGPFDADLTKVQPPEMNADPTAAVIAGKLRLHWRDLQADMAAKGFDLRPVVGKEPASAYVLAYVHAAAPQQVQLQWQSAEKVKVWLNGKSVELKSDAAPLALEKGWNTLLLRLNNEQGEPFLSARIIGGERVRISLQKD
ncbi:MAG TPA: PVC-type heme-binding CxxCH protein [Gemmataceae bacterium]|nr:PVC-type heme-binding CxxCH protein [Gemmataceae bacterium]